MPGTNARAMDKARGLACDALIFDLEDAVAPDRKAQARQQVVDAVTAGGYGYRELIVRTNGLDTPWGVDDVVAAAGLDVDAVLLPKVDRVVQVESVLDALAAAGDDDKPIWLMIETPLGILNLTEVAAYSPRIATLVMGTSDLITELRARHTESRDNLSYALQRAVLVARSLGLDILDGVHLDFRNLESFRLDCAHGRGMGFDGKTLIHPGQVAIANELYGLDDEAVEHARGVLRVWCDAIEAGKGVAVLDGQLIENVHAAEAERVIAFAAAIAAR